MAVAIGVGRSGVDALLVASQVALSIVLPFIVFPLIYLTTNKEIMSVKKPVPEPAPMQQRQPTQSSIEYLDVESSKKEEMVDFSNGKIAASIGYLIWFVVMAANVYAIVTLAMGEGGA